MNGSLVINSVAVCRTEFKGNVIKKKVIRLP
jgi:hypothetical protein